MQTKKTIEKINEIALLKKINKIDKSLARLSKDREDWNYQHLEWHTQYQYGLPRYEQNNKEILQVTLHTYIWQLRQNWPILYETQPQLIEVDHLNSHMIIKKIKLKILSKINVCVQIVSLKILPNIQRSNRNSTKSPPKNGRRGNIF